METQVPRRRPRASLASKIMSIVIVVALLVGVFFITQKLLAPNPIPDVVDANSQSGGTPGNDPNRDDTGNQVAGVGGNQVAGVGGNVGGVAGTGGKNPLTASNGGTAGGADPAASTTGGVTNPGNGTGATQTGGGSASGGTASSDPGTGGTLVASLPKGGGTAGVDKLIPPPKTLGTPSATPTEQMIEPPVVAQVPVSVQQDQELQAFKRDVLQRIREAQHYGDDERVRAQDRVKGITKLMRIGVYTFGVNKRVLSNDWLAALEDNLSQPPVKLFLAQDPNARFVILGFADPTGTLQGNVKLSKERADYVRGVIQRKFQQNVQAFGIGPTMILKQNRAVEVWLGSEKPTQ